MQIDLKRSIGSIAQVPWIYLTRSTKLFYRIHLTHSIRINLTQSSDSFQPIYESISSDFQIRLTQSLDPSHPIYMNPIPHDLNPSLDRSHTIARSIIYLMQSTEIHLTIYKSWDLIQSTRSLGSISHNLRILRIHLTRSPDPSHPILSSNQPTRDQVDEFHHDLSESSRGLCFSFTTLISKFPVLWQLNVGTHKKFTTFPRHCFHRNSSHIGLPSCGAP